MHVFYVPVVQKPPTLDRADLELWYSALSSME